MLEEGMKTATIENPPKVMDIAELAEAASHTS
jgi:hypothetical protein